MAQSLPERQSQGINLASMLPTLASIFLGSGGSTTTTSPRLTQGGMDAATRRILESTQGLAGVAGGQRNSGLYNSSTNQMLVNDLISRTAGEVAMNGTPQTVTQSGTAPLIDPMVAIGGLLAAQAFSKDGLGGMFGGGSGGGAATTGGATQASGAGPLSDIGGQLSGTWDKIVQGLGFGGAEAAGSVATTAADAVSQLPVSAATSAADLTSLLGFDANNAQRWLDSMSGADQLSTMDTRALDLGSMPLGTMLGLAQGDFEGVARSTVMGGLGSALGAATAIPGIGPIIGLIGSIFGKGSVVCTELVNSGMMPTHLYRLDTDYAAKYLNLRVLYGYRWWGVPLVKKMRKYTWLKKAVAPWAIGRARHLSRDYNFLGFVARTVGEPICWVIGCFVTPLTQAELTAELYSDQKASAQFELGV